MEEKRFCPNCGAAVTKGDLFCVECGSKIEFKQMPESVKTVSTAETAQKFPQVQGQMQGEPQNRTGKVIRRIDGYFTSTGTFFARQGTMVLTDTKLIFNTYGLKKEIAIEIFLKDIVKVDRYNRQSLSSFIVYLANKQYIFSTRGPKDRKGFLQQINDAVEKAKKEEYAPLEQEPDYIGEIRRLKELADAGIITKQEFESKKKSLLGL